MFVLILIPLNFVSHVSIYIKSAMDQVMAWCLFGTKALPEQMMTQFTDAYMSHQASMG